MLGTIIRVLYRFDWRGGEVTTGLVLCGYGFGSALAPGYPGPGAVALLLGVLIQAAAWHSMPIWRRSLALCAGFFWTWEGLRLHAALDAREIGMVAALVLASVLVFLTARDASDTAEPPGNE